MRLKPETIEQIYFSISYVARELGVKEFNIRFWTKEFKIQVDRDKGKRRRFTVKEIAILRQIKELSDSNEYTLFGISKRINP